MGGRALKNCEIRRVGAEEHRRIGEYVLQHLEQLLPGCRLEVLPAYRQKKTFGNLSIFVQSDAHRMDRAFAQELAKRFASNEFVVNDNRVSVEVIGHQVDISVYPSQSFQTALDYHSFNTLGGLIGVLAHSVGLTLHENALVYNFMEGTQKLAEVTVASTWADILSTLGLSHARWSEGFETLADLFVFVSTSALFTPALFQDRSYTDIPQGMPLTVPQEFGKWLDSLDARELPSHVTVSKEAWRAKLFESRPQVHEQQQAALQRRAAQVAASEKLNGNLVREWTGREKAKLGKLMQAIRESFDSVEKQLAWTLSASAEDIKSRVLTLHAAV